MKPIKQKQTIKSKNSGKTAEKKGKENVKPFEFIKGQSGNPNGRPPGKSMTTILKDLLEKKMTLSKDPFTGEDLKNEKFAIREILMMRLLAMGIKGDRYAIESILDRVEGKANQPVEHSGGLLVGNISLEQKADQVMALLGIKTRDK